MQKITPIYGYVCYIHTQCTNVFKLKNLTLLGFFSLLFSVTTSAQTVAINWWNGRGYLVDFRTATPTITCGLPTDGAFEATATWSDTSTGDEIRYIFTIENTGNVDITNIILSDPLPGIVVGGGPIDFVTDDTSFTATYILTEQDLLSGNVRNQATVTGQDPAGNDVTDI